MQIINHSHFLKLDKTISQQNKVKLTYEFLKSIGSSDDIFKKLITIRNLIKTNIVYGIKKKGDKYRLEIYLYNKCSSINCSHKSDTNIFINNINLILNEFKINKPEKINSLINGFEFVNLVSFDIDLNNFSFNNKLHIYAKIKYDRPIKNRIHTKDATNVFYILEYDFISNEIQYESIVFQLVDYNELEDTLRAFNKRGLSINYKNLNNDLKKITSS